MFRSAAFHGHMLRAPSSQGTQPASYSFCLWILHSDHLPFVKPKEFLLYFFDDEEKNISRNTLSSGWGAGKRRKKENHFPPCLNPNIFILEVFETYSWIGAFAVFFQRIIFKYLPYYHYFPYITVIHAQKQFTHIT